VTSYALACSVLPGGDDPVDRPTLYPSAKSAKETSPSAQRRQIDKISVQ
jgi:hypothetical protein